MTKYEVITYIYKKKNRGLEADNEMRNTDFEPYGLYGQNLSRKNDEKH